MAKGRKKLRKRSRHPDAGAAIALESAHRRSVELNEIGIKAYNSGDVESARSYYQQALEIYPNNSDSMQLLGLIYYTEGEMARARELLEASISLNSEFHSAHNTYALILIHYKDFEGAERHLKKALELNPDCADYYLNLGNLCQLSIIQPQRALEYFKQGVDKFPEHHPLLHNCASLLLHLHMTDEAIPYLEKAYEINPDYAPSVTNLAIAYRNKERFEECEKLMREVLDKNPDLVDQYNTLGMVIVDQGRYEEAAEVFKKAIEAGPRERKAIHNLLFHATYRMQLSPEALLREHQRWVPNYSPLPEEKIRMQPMRTAVMPNKKLRIGYVSPDFKNHVVRNFIEPVIECHDRKRVEVFLYSNVEVPDTTTEHFMRIADHFTHTHFLSALELANKIREDGIDVLIDLAGHSGGNRLDTFAFKPAPVQVAYLGYIATTGLPQIDYRITDHTLNPPDTKELLSEKLYHLPRCYKAYLPGNVEPYPIVRPESSPGEIIFGSMHRLQKITDKTVRVWGALLKELPNSKLLLIRRELAYEKNREEMIRLFSEAGVKPENILLKHKFDWNHLPLYGEMDISLDPMPVTGGATTAESIWMGCPVLTLAGDVMRERISATILKAANMGEWVAETEEEFVAKGVEFAHNPEYLKQQRETARYRFDRSELADGKGLAEALENAYLDMWNKYVESRQLSML